MNLTQAVAPPPAYPGTVNVLAAILVASTSLNITVWPNGRAHTPKRTYTLTCVPVGGTLPHRAAAFVGQKVVHEYYESDADLVFKPIRAFFAQHGVEATFVHVPNPL